MSLAKTLEQTKKSITQPASACAYEEARERHSALAPYPSAVAALAAVSAGSPLTIAERDAVLVAILSELRATKRSVWQALAVMAFEPLLVRVRAHLGHPQVVRFGRSTDDDRDQRVLLAFLEAIHTLRVASHAARQIRLALERQIYGEEQVEREAPSPAEFIDDAYDANSFAVTTSERAAAVEIARILEAEGGAELRDMMIATRANDVSLRAYVEEAYPAASKKERASVYCRLHTARVRVERRLRGLAARPEHRRFVVAA